MNLTKKEMHNIYYKMYLSRTFEERVNELFKAGMIYGTTHLSVGEEATAVGGVNALQADDCI
ncbi:MAG: pyruvate dehydrogenase, partial [Christensenella sp.]